MDPLALTHWGQVTTYGDIDLGQHWLWLWLVPGAVRQQAITWANVNPDLCRHMMLTPKHRETHGCVVSTVATDALVLKHQAISIHNAD